MYQNFIGIDIGKKNFFASLHGSKEVDVFNNTAPGFKKFLKKYKTYLTNGLVVLETTGGYEQALLSVLYDEKIASHRANTRKVKSFIRSYGQLGKSDKIDAKALARYGQERHASLDLYKPNPRKKLMKLAARRADLKHMLVQEKNRLKAPDQGDIKRSYKMMIQVINTELGHIEQQINDICDQDEQLSAEKKVLITVAGIGDVVAMQLLATLPELGRLDRRKIASLAGLAPHPNESGEKTGYRRVRGGRSTVKPILFMAAMAASRSQSRLGAFYNRLVSNGKKKMVALTALMRKILVIANARIRELYSPIPA